jgi:hypothetical protein
MHRGLLSILFILSAFTFSFRSAQATTITTTTFNNWKATLTGSPVEADFTAVQFRNYNTSAGLVLAAIGNPSVGFTFTGPDNGSYSLTGTTYNGVTGLAGSSDAGAALQVTMPASGENAILLSIGSTSGTPLTLAFSDGETFSSNGGLLGFSISHTISWLQVTTTSGSQAVINDFWFGNSSLAQDATGVPEGRTLLLMSGGLLILAGAGRRFGRKIEC